MSEPTTTFVYKIESDRALLAAVSQMYDEVMADEHLGAKPALWRGQLSILLARFGRDVVIESLMEAVPSLSLRHAVIMADLAERAPSGRMSAV